MPGGEPLHHLIDLFQRISTNFGMNSTGRRPIEQSSAVPRGTPPSTARCGHRRESNHRPSMRVVWMGYQRLAASRSSSMPKMLPDKLQRMSRIPRPHPLRLAGFMNQSRAVSAVSATSAPSFFAASSFPGLRSTTVTCAPPFLPKLNPIVTKTSGPPDAEGGRNCRALLLRGR